LDGRDRALEGFRAAGGAALAHSGEVAGAEASAWRETPADRWNPPIRRTRARGRAAWLGRAGPVWAEMVFSFSREFLIAFLFYFL
jgi:hypothetical protein